MTNAKDPRLIALYITISSNIDLFRKIVFSVAGRGLTSSVLINFGSHAPVEILS